MPDQPTRITAYEAMGDWLAAAWGQPATVARVALPTGGINCRIWEAREESEKAPLLLVHGFRANAHWWDHVGPVLASDRRVVAMDLGGMGDSDWCADYSLEQHGREIVGVIDGLGLSDATVIAHSFGTFCALYAAQQAPDRIQSLVLIDGYPIPPLKGGIPEKPATFHPSRQAILDRYRLIPPGRWPDPRIVDYIAERSIKETPQGWTWKFDPRAPEHLNKKPQVDKIEGVTVPANLIYGEFTELLPPERLQDIRHWLPTSRDAIMLPMSHHHVMIEQPQAMIAALNALLAGVRKRVR